MPWEERGLLWGLGNLKWHGAQQGLVSLSVQARRVNLKLHWPRWLEDSNQGASRTGESTPPVTGRVSIIVMKHGVPGGLQLVHHYL